MPTLTKCQECGSEDKIYSIGPGVERIAEELEQTLPQARIMVLTSDTMMSRKSVEEALDKIHAHEVDIIVGTQLLTKGLHFPKLNIVGVLDADGSINGGDIRTMERTYQLLHQVAGRAGREKEKGIVYIQTHEPNSILLQNLVNNDREAFVSNELENRKLANMPPFSRLISISISSLSEADNITFCQALSKNMPDLDGITILGPSPAPMYVLKRQYRHRFIIIAARDISIQKIVKQWLNSVQRPRNIKIRVDVDPYSFA
jgi:primosomal protein N' (replication factor Y)